MPIPGTFNDPKKGANNDPAVTSPLVISNVAVVLRLSFGGFRAYRITWTTDQASSSQIQWGLSPSMDTVSVEKDTDSPVTSHRIDYPDSGGVKNVLVGTQFYFRVISRLPGGKDGANNSVMDGYQFTQDGTFVAA